MPEPAARVKMSVSCRDMSLRHVATCLAPCVATNQPLHELDYDTWAVVSIEVEGDVERAMGTVAVFEQPF